jgi:hypothetical protein
MSRKAFKADGTLRLQSDFIRCNRDYDRALTATPLNPLLWVGKERRAEKLSRKLDILEDELEDRYEGITRQMLRRGKIESATSVKMIWSMVRTRALTSADDRSLPSLLWRAYLEQENAGLAIVNVLRPKFMLRQFVDEIENTSHRDLIRVVAYGGHSDNDFTRETFTMFTKALGSLHQALLGHASQLEVITDRTFTRSDISGFSDPFSEYRDWLVKC